MTSEAQRIAIAEALGIKTFPLHQWEGHDDNRYFKCIRCAETIGWGEYSKNKGIFAHPCSGTDKNFPECLNAMHEAEEAVTSWCDYWQALETLTESRTFCKEIAVDCRCMLHATAAQRAEAFLRTLNKWDDSK